MPSSSSGGPIDRIAPTIRPQGPLAGYQVWTNLLFIHWRVPAAAIAPLVPQPLTIDTYDGDAWVGLIPFQMSGVRPWWFPGLPGLSRFLETNVRTYVHLDGKDPGVWFHSLDASNSLAVRVARWRWSLPYYHAAMRLERDDARIRYHSRRTCRQPPAAGLDIEARIGARFEPGRTGIPIGNAAPGTLPHFLVERYFLYTVTKTGGLLRGQVHHKPYPLKHAELGSLQQDLLQSASIEPAGAEDQLVLFSEGVEVDIYPLKRVS